MAGESDTRNLLVLIGGVLLTTFVLGLWANTAQWVGMKAATSSTPALVPAETPGHACPQCAGTGKVPCSSCRFAFRPSASSSGSPPGWCLTCLSVGQIKCTWCKGEGKVRTTSPVFGG